MHGVRSKFQTEQPTLKAGDNPIPQMVLSPEAVEAGRMSLWAWYWSQPEEVRRKIDAAREAAP